MTDTLAMLSAQDWALLREQATARTYRRGETLVAEGQRHRALCILRQGTVRVEQTYRGQRFALAQLGPGEIFGEMGFVEDAPASAAIVAEDDVVVEVIDDAALHSLIASIPGFATRFYHSLAIALARRVRVTSHRLAQAGAGEMAQLNPFHLPRTGNVSPRQLPPTLRAGLAAFAQTLGRLDDELGTGTRSVEAAQAPLAAACDAAVSLLARSMADQPVLEMGWDDLLAFRDLPQLEAGVGDYVFRTTFPFFMLSATMARCYAKPRGFPEDAETVAMIDRAEAEGDGRLGPLIDRWFLDRPLCRARRAGRTWMAATLATEVAARPSGEPVRVASLASGAAAELFDLYRTDTAARVRATCVDLDPEALLTTARTAQQRGLSDRVMCLRGNAVPVAGESLALPPQQIIYALGLWEYLRDDQAVAFLDWAHDHLVDDGLLIVTNLQPANPDRLLMAHLLDWRVTHRSVDDVQRLVAQSRFRAQAPTLAIEVTESQLFVRCPKG